MADLRIRVLGPVRAWRDGEPLDVGPTGQRALLALLALAPGRLLSHDELTGSLWPGRRPPPAAANIIQTYVARLRRLLEPGRPPRAASAVLPRTGDGYLLSLPRAAVDVLRFRDHVAAAATAHRHGRGDRAVEALAQALRLWHGPVAADVPLLADHPLAAATAEERQQALARYGELLAATGRAAEALSPLAEAAALQPLNEVWQARLILAYQAVGRRGQAFETYHEVRRRLAEELGVDPGEELAAAHAALLRADAAVDVPSQLPADSPVFTGRADELARLDLLLAGPAASAAVVVVSGPPGVGKTALAVHWARRIAPRFPDGQLHLNLRGFHPDGDATQPSDAVRSTLETLGVTAPRMPETIDAQVAMYRSRLAGRRMLIMLDNARDAEQVRPLLPGAPGCLVLITSRHQLTGLVAAEGAHPVPLRPLAPTDARRLLTRRIGAARIAAEPAAAAELIDRCAGLPLALVVIAARAALSPDLPLRVLAGRLRRGDRCLDALATGDPSTDLRSVFSWSYRALRPATARLFRLLGLHVGPEISAAAAASLTGRTRPEAARLLTDLVQAGLATEPVAGRYLLHDLVRSYAVELAVHAVPARTARAATMRILDHYLHSAYRAGQLAHPAPDDRFTPEEHGSAVVPELATGAEDALAWLVAERAVLVAAVEWAAARAPRHGWQLARSLATFLDRCGRWEDLAAVQRAAVDAARRDGDAAAQAAAHRWLARACTRLRRVDDAHRELLRAGELYRATGDPAGLCRIHLDLALLRERQARYRDALAHAGQGLALFRAAGDAQGTARALNAVGWYHALLGDHAAALEHCEAALVHLEGLDDRATTASTLDSIGFAHHHLGRPAQAVGVFRRAAELYRELGDGHLEAFVLTHLGDAYAAVGRTEAAHEVWRQALDALERFDPPEADRVRTRLGRLPADRAG
ncbi:BTAD domain-containing putative transcriptional regulator [Catellatospora sp. KI3]|uniref:AfsR/SARP family transcriptional regulator n=1 Tax=Catellatospora sp. KI3 TaxID=3041620 RepID=UPI0024828837|nr:BTAD domain-containing putative transcriptional regulator [Catellatospora sp. KI3]MDI1465408.1 BTAD domain-containing putative transcriptional regulator [Catellatospora sp. KI3]